MPEPSAPKRPTKTGPKVPRGRPRTEVARDAKVELRTFSELRDRLDAMVLLRNRPSRSSLLEYYAMRGIEQDERELGIIEDVPSAILSEPLPVFERLEARKKNRVLALYRRAGILAKEREGLSIERY